MKDPAYRRAYLRMRVAHQIAKTVILARGERRWSQARLAAEIGTTQSVVSRLESGQHKVSVETLRRIANALDVTFIIDPDGVLRYTVVHDNSIGRNTDETLRVLQALQTGEKCPIDWKPGEATLG